MTAKPRNKTQKGGIGPLAALLLPALIGAAPGLITSISKVIRGKGHVQPKRRVKRR